MSILIKGMEMPENCLDCDFLWFNDHTGASNTGQCDIVETWIKDVFVRPDWCPLVEIPETKIDDGQDLDIDSEALEAWLKEVFNIFGARMEE